MLRASYVVALVVLPAFAGCQTYSSDTNIPPARFSESPRQQIPPLSDAPSPLAQTAAPAAYSPASTTAPSRVQETPPVAASLTVANVHKEAVSLFRVQGDELTFVATVPAGEAIDLPVNVGAKLSATFSQAPHCANFAVKGQAAEVWLLRPATGTDTPAPVLRLTPNVIRSIGPISSSSR